VRRPATPLLLAIALLAALLAPLASLTPSAEAQSAAAKEDCTTLECPRCQTMCTLLCDHEADVCRKSGARNCPRNARSCARNCPAQFCRQCMPDQFDGNGRRYVQGPTRICQSRAQWK
jgi:hypothetical protein